MLHAAEIWWNLSRERTSSHSKVDFQFTPASSGRKKTLELFVFARSHTLSFVSVFARELHRICQRGINPFFKKLHLLEVRAECPTFKLFFFLKLVICIKLVCQIWNSY